MTLEDTSKLDMTPREFMTLLWGDPPPGPVYVFLLPQKRAVWFTHYENLNRLAGAHSAMDLYTGGGTGPRDNRQTLPNRRLTQDEVTGITGLWADLDVAHEVHPKKNLPPTIQAALEILEQANFEPTLLVDSGHGIQAWWLFDEPWNFESPQENLEARRLTQWWGNYISSLYAAAGWNIDSVHNLDRIMRIPGTFNNKVKSDAKAVAVISNTGIRHSRDAFQELIPPDYQPRTIIQGTDASGKAVGGENLILDPQAQPDMMKFSELCAEDPRFLRSWQENRTDWPDEADRSASAYDLSLSNMAARNGWSDQEICDLLIAKRRHHGQNLKLRENYYANTIALARQPGAIARAQELLKEAMEMIEEEKDTDDIMNALSIMMGIRIRRVVKFVGDPPQFWMSTDQGDITIGKVDGLMSQSKFINLVAAITGVVMVPCKTHQWRERVQAILSAAVEEDVGDASHPATETRAWLTAYLSEHAPLINIPQATVTRMSFISNGRVHIFKERFSQWLEHSYNEMISTFSMGQRLKLVGARQETINTTINGLRTTRSTWRLPHEFDDWEQRALDELNEIRENQELDQQEEDGE